MPPSRRDLASVLLATALVPAAARAQVRDPLVIARGGAAGDAPAETKGAYDQAIRDGADFLAAELAVSRDGVLVARRDHELSATTDVAAHPEFTPRRASKTIGGVAREGWFAEDFTLAELKTLNVGAPSARRAKGEAPTTILTFEELIALARAGCVRTARVIGVYAVLPAPAYFASLDLALEPRVAEAISRGGYNSPAAAMMVASADPEALRRLARLTRARRVLRVAPGAPADFPAVRAYAQGVAPDLAAAVAIGPTKRPTPTPLIGKAHAAGLVVHAWAAPADSQALMQAAFAAGADAIGADTARPAAKARRDAG